MEKIIKRYIEEQSKVQILARDKMFEGIIDSIQEKVVHLIGEKYEYYLPMEHILSLGAKLNKEKRISIIDKSDRVGFK